MSTLNDIKKANLEIPETVKQAYITALNILWQEAQDAANEAFQMAKRNWEIERSEADEVNRELIEAYEEQTSTHELKLEEINEVLINDQHQITSLQHELAKAHKELSRNEKTIANLLGQVEALKSQVESLLNKLNL